MLVDCIGRRLEFHGHEISPAADTLQDIDLGQPTVDLQGHVLNLNVWYGLTVTRSSPDRDDQALAEGRESCMSLEMSTRNVLVGVGRRRALS
jgi:hypothetical protein